MKQIAVVVVATILVCAAAVAQEHDPMTEEHLLQMLHEGSTVGTFSTVATGNTVTVNMVEKQFDFTPSSITVNQGDTLVIHLSVPANDQSAAHGMLMETYVTSAVVVFPGQTKTITINATQDGTFLWACSQSACGSGHSNMIGMLTVKKISNPAPTVAQISPTSGSTAGGTSVTITGANFQSNATVTFGGVAATSVTVTSSTSLVAVTPPAANPGAAAIVVTNGDGQSVTFNGFSYTPAGPSITSISPATGPTSGGTTFTIASTGGFVAGAAVTVGGRAAGQVNVVNANTITALSPLGLVSEEAAIPEDVVVINPDGTRITKTGAFQYFVPPLSVSSMSPAASVTAGGVDVTLSGVGFNGAVVSSVTFGGVAATNIRVFDPITMIVTAPAHGAGSVDVVVTVGGSSVTVKNGYTYGDPPPRKRAAKH